MSHNAGLQTALIGAGRKASFAGKCVLEFAKPAFGE